MNLELKLMQERLGVKAIIKHSQQKTEWIFNDLIERGEQWIVSGAPKAGKSRFALQLALCASEGRSFLDFKCPKKHCVLYVDFELSPRISASRVLNFYKNDHSQLSRNESFFKCSDHKQIDVNSTAECIAIKKIIETLNPDLIIWDVLARMHSVDENSNIAMIQIMQNIRQLSHGAAHIVVHHARKENFGNGGAKALRGASSIHGEADGVMALALETSKKGSHSVLFSTRAIEDPGKMWLESEGLGFRKAKDIFVEDTKSLPVTLQNIFKDRVSIKKPELVTLLEGELKIGARQLERKLNEMVLDGLLTKSKVGREAHYSLALLN